MWTLGFFLTVALLFGFSDALLGCKDPELVKNFTMDKMEGVYYEIRGTVPESILKCTSYTIAPDEGSKTKGSALKKYTHVLTGKKESVYFELKSFNSNPASIRATPLKGNIFHQPYTFNVVHLDDSCLIVHICSKALFLSWDDVFILAKKTELTDKEVMACLKIVKDKELDGKELFKYKQDCKKEEEEEEKEE